MHYFFKNLLLYSQAWCRQIKSVVMMNKTKSTKIVNFMTPGAGVLVLEHGHISQSESTLSLCITLIAIVIRDYLLLSSAIVDFLFIYDGAVDM